MTSVDRTERDRFCPRCDIDLGLHDTDEPDEDGFDCHIAALKANLLTDFAALLGGRHG